MKVLNTHVINYKDPDTKQFNNLNVIGVESETDETINPNSKNPVQNVTIFNKLYTPLTRIQNDYYDKNENAVIFKRDTDILHNEFGNIVYYKNGELVEAEADERCSTEFNIHNVVSFVVESDFEYPFIVFGKDMSVTYICKNENAQKGSFTKFKYYTTPDDYYVCINAYGETLQNGFRIKDCYIMNPLIVIDKDNENLNEYGGYINLTDLLDRINALEECVTSLMNDTNNS